MLRFVGDSSVPRRAKTELVASLPASPGAAECLREASKLSERGAGGAVGLAVRLLALVDHAIALAVSPQAAPPRGARTCGNLSNGGHSPGGNCITNYGPRPSSLCSLCNIGIALVRCYFYLYVTIMAISL